MVYFVCEWVPIFVIYFHNCQDFKELRALGSTEKCCDVSVDERTTFVT